MVGQRRCSAGVGGSVREGSERRRNEVKDQHARLLKLLNRYSTVKAVTERERAGWLAGSGLEGNWIML